MNMPGFLANISVIIRAEMTSSSANFFNRYLRVQLRRTRTDHFNQSVAGTRRGDGNQAIPGVTCISFLPDKFNFTN